MKTLVAAVLVCLLMVTVAGCSPSPRPPLYAAGGDKTPTRTHVGGKDTWAIAQGRSLSLLVAVPVCTKAASVSVQSVTLHDPTPGFVLRNWGIVNGPVSSGVSYGPLLTLDAYDSHRVTVHCWHGMRWANIGVEVARTSPRPVHAMGFDVHYRVGNSKEVLWLGSATELTRRKTHKA